jgi:hypothetical protein
MPQIRFALALAVVITGCAQRADGADADHPTVVELFQSQGCSSCPPANANLNALAGRRDILALSFAVTYWDRLGWKDTFAQPRFTQRQWDYAKRGGRGNVSTPQMIVNGRGVLIGHHGPEVAAFIRKYDRGTSGPVLTPRAGTIRIGQAKAAVPSTVWLVRYDPRTRAVPIRAGENEGRKLPHRNIVIQLERLGQWTGPPRSFTLPASRDPALKSAVMVQQGVGGPIIAARRI